jgi:DNA polymerase III epsilon subunit-like protein
MTKEVFISVDIEASGPVPGTYSMLALGACVVGNDAEQFYAELRPINEASVPGAMAVVGKTIEEFRQAGREPAEAMLEFGAWVRRVVDGGKAVFVGFNAAFDWSFVNWYFDTYQGENPFGVGGLDIKSFYMGMSGCAWDETRSSRLPVKYRGEGAHTHNALSDAIEQAGIFERIGRDAGVIK